MKARKNKKRIDTKYQMPREEKSTVKEDIDFNDFSFDSWLIHEMYPEAGSMPTGEDYRSRGKRRDGLPEEIPKDDPRDQANRDVNSSMEEGHCAAEMPPEDAEEEIAPHHPDNAFESGYAAAVEEIMASIEGLLGDPIEMAPVGPEMDMEQLPDHAMEINEDEEDEEDEEAEEAKEAEEAEEARRNKMIQQQDRRRAKGVSGDVTMRAMRGGGVTKEEKKPGEDDHAEVKEEAMNEQPSIEDMMKKSLKDSPYADMPSVEVRLNRKEPGVKETVPMIDSARSRNPEALKDIIRNWLGVGYGVDEVELTSDGQALDVAEFLDIDPMEEA